MNKNNNSYEQFHSSRWYAKKYRAYKKSFYQRAEVMRNKGLLPYTDKPENFRTWKTAYVAEHNDRVKEMEKGERKNMGDINKKLVSNTLYELSEKQAYKIFDYIRRAELSSEELKDMGFSYKNINDAIAKIRQGEFVKTDLELWEKIKTRRAELFSQKKSKAEVRKIISQEFFYPEEG